MFWSLFAVLAIAMLLATVLFKRAAGVSDPLLMLALLSCWFVVPDRLPISRCHGYLYAIQDYTVRFHGSKVDTRDGQFGVDSVLSSLRVDSRGGLPGLVTLVFDGHVVHPTELVAWPGVPEEVAIKIRDRVLGLLDGALTSASS